MWTGVAHKKWMNRIALSAISIFLFAITMATGQQVEGPVQQQRRAQIRKQAKLQLPIAVQKPARIAIRSAPINPARSNVIFVEPTAPIINLFARAEEGIARRDWKFAIDSLQRIIDDPQASLMPRDRQTIGDAVLYESARKKAIRQIAQLPPQGLRAYRLLYDGKAKGYLDRAKAHHDADLLRSAVNRFLLSRHGDDAADLLASWALDEGRITEAISLLEDVLEFVPDFDVPRSLLVSKLAVAYHLAGMTSSAEKLLAENADQAQENSSLPKWYSHLTDATLLHRDEEKIEDLKEWPLYGGTLQRTGRMPAVSPTLIANTPWVYQLPGSNSYSWRQMIQMQEHEPDTLPTIHAVANRNQIFIRKPSGVVALDPDELRVLWEMPPSTQLPAMVLGNTNSAAIDFARWSSGVAFSNSVISSIAVTDRMVFTVEPDGRGTIPGEDAASTPLARRINRPFRSGRSVDTSSRLVAYDVTTGERLWHRGRTFDPNDLLGEVEFRSLPLKVHDRLWVTYLDRADLYFGVLDPKDGSVVHRILLGSHRSIASERGPVLSPAFHEGIFYIPTHLGLLFAVDAASYEVRWASEYRRHLITDKIVRSARRFNRRNKATTSAFYQKSWLASPPVVSQGKVLLAAMDTDELQAFSSVDGDLLWTADSADRYYIIGADQRTIWLGGRGVSAFSITDGSLEWKYDLESIPTGQAVLSGSTIHIPCADGLVTLDARSGNVIHQKELPGKQPPLGNLLCFRSGLYSLDPAGLHMYPDVDQIYSSALASFQQDPQNVSMIMRLAWMQLLRDEPDKAYDTLTQVTASMAEKNPRWTESIAQIQVIALQEMAENRPGQPEEALSLLETANRLARRQEDKLDVTLALATLYRRTGDPVKAYEILYEIGMQQDASTLVSREDRVEVGVRVDLSERMREIDRELSPPHREELSNKMRSQLEGACDDLNHPAQAGRARKRLTLMSDLEVVGGVGSLALLSLAEWEVEHLRYERAEQLLKDSARWSDDPEISIASWIKLFELYVGEKVGMKRSALRALDQLDSLYAQVPLPFALFARMGWNDSLRIQQGVVEDWTSLMFEELQIKTDVKVHGKKRGRLIELEDEPNPSWVLTIRTRNNAQPELPFAAEGDLLRSLASTVTPRLFHFDEKVKELLGDKVVFRSRGDVLYCQHAATGALLWQTTLQLPQSFETVFSSRMGNRQNYPRRAATDGQIGIFNGREGLFAVGLLTGRRLWVKPYDVPSEFGSESLRDPIMAASEGYLAAIPHTGRLSMIRIRDGFSLWQRDLRGERIASISMTSEVVITTDPASQRVHLFNRSNGKLIKRVHFTQPGTDEVLVNLIETHGVLCGPDENAQSDMIKGVDLSTGKTLWQIEVDKPVIQMFKPQEGFVGIGLLGGDVRVIRARTGEVLLDHRISKIHSVVAGEMLDATFIVKCLINRNKMNRYELIAIDIPTGEELWRRKDVIDTMSGESSSLLYGRTLPAIIEYPDPTDPRRVRWGLAMFDTRGGTILGGIAGIDSAQSGVRYNGDFAIMQGAAIVGTTAGIKTFPIFMEDENTGSGF